MIPTLKIIQPKNISYEEYMKLYHIYEDGWYETGSADDDSVFTWVCDLSAEELDIYIKEQMFLQSQFSQYKRNDHTLIKFDTRTLKYLQRYDINYEIYSFPPNELYIGLDDLYSWYNYHGFLFYVGERTVASFRVDLQFVTKYGWYSINRKNPVSKNWKEDYKNPCFYFMDKYYFKEKEDLVRFKLEN